jgi:hypothetical protein
MNEVFAARRVIARYPRKDISGSIYISRPIVNDNNKFFCSVEFDMHPKYSDIVFGTDEIHALECAISYTNSICQNSTEPEFFWTNGDTMLVRDVHP